MSSIGSMNKPTNGLLVGAVQMPVPIVNSRKDIDKQLKELVRVTHSMKAGYPGIELVVFPEYSLQGLCVTKWLTDEFLCDIPGPETEVLGQACKEAGVYGVFSIMERNPEKDKNPYNSAIIINDKGEIILHYRKLYTWTNVEPWLSGFESPTEHFPVCDGPGGSKLGIVICHDGMFPEMSREYAYRGCNVLIRISGYSTQVVRQWELTNRANAWNNLMYTVSVNLSGYDGTFYYGGTGQICNYDGTTLVQGHRDPYEIVTGEIYPHLADQARKEWGLENNIYDLGHPGFVAMPGGSKPEFSHMRDLLNGEYKLPWDDEVKIKDGTMYGYPKPDGKRFGEEPYPDPHGIHDFKGLDYRTDQ